MSLFVDVIEVLSNRIKSELYGIIESNRKKQDRPVRKICDTCAQYLDFGELRYDKMEDGISRLNDIGISGDALYGMLYAVLQESLDEDATALEYFIQFADSSLAAPFRQEMLDFITIGKFATLKDRQLLDEAATIMIERYSTEKDISDIISNLYLQVDDDQYISVFQQLVDKARLKYPAATPLEALEGFINVKGKDFQKALDSFMRIKSKLEQDAGDPYYAFHMASVWDNIAGCWLKMGNSEKTLESCQQASAFEDKSEEVKIGSPILYKKAEALILKGDKEEAGKIIGQILEENPGDETALEIKGKL